MNALRKFFAQLFSGPAPVDPVPELPESIRRTVGNVIRSIEPHLRDMMLELNLSHHMSNHVEVIGENNFYAYIENGSVRTPDNVVFVVVCRADSELDIAVGEWATLLYLHSRYQDSAQKLKMNTDMVTGLFPSEREAHVEPACIDSFEVRYRPTGVVTLRFACDMITT